MVNKIAFGAQDSKYLRAIALAVYLPERSWSSQLLAAKIPGTNIKHARVTAGPRNLDLMLSFNKSYIA